MCLLALSAAASAQLRVVTWNVTNYDGADRGAAFQTAIYGEFQGRSMRPDVFIGQEFLSAASVTTFLNLLNTANGSPGDWAAAPFINGADTDSAFFYRTSKVQYLGVTVVATGSSATTNHPRNLQRYDIRLVGYGDVEGAKLSLYSSHMKSGPEATDLSRRLLEAQRLRDNAELLPAGRNFMVGADFNIPTSTESAYQEMVGSQLNNAGRFFDPINRPGSWQNSNTFRFIHTQDPAGAGGMDDRFDQLLVSAGLVDGTGFDYIGNPAIPYSNTTWNDPNHSHRAWGNDGGSFNGVLAVANNLMVGGTIAQALVDSADGQGHLPVFLDLRVPPRVQTVATLDFGKVMQFAKPISRTFSIANTGDTTLWTQAGVANLVYSFAAPSGFQGAVTNAVEAPGGGSNIHEIVMDTRVAGYKNVTLQIQTNSPEQPVVNVQLVGYVVPSRTGRVP